MCGIIGIVGTEPVAEKLIEGLKRLEYRGYDSAGLATLDTSHKIHRCRAEGKIVNLEKVAKKSPPPGNTGIAHTRWATHGAPSLQNAHPHGSEQIAVVHNGIIENFLEIRKELEQSNAIFETDTDTEVIPHLIERALKQGETPQQAVFSTVKKLQGAFSLGIIFSGNDNFMAAVKQGSPLAIGYGDGENYLGSDALALAPLSSKLSYLQEGDIAFLTRDDVTIYNQDQNQVTREIVHVSSADMQTAKGHYRHYMLKEIYEQPSVIGTTLSSYYHPVTGDISLPDLPFDLSKLSEINIVACGTSYYAGSVAKYWLEQLAHLQVNMDIASEFRYRKPILKKDGLTLVISQSGETADTLAALRYAKEKGQNTLAIVNVKESTIAREADCIAPTHAGPEIGVASTKAFTTQLVVLACITLAIGRARDIISHKQEQELSHSLAEVSSRALEVLNHDEVIRELAQEISLAQDIIYIGRGTSYPIAQEGALKLKEISYIHAEASAAGELKHGPISLIDDTVPIIAIAPTDSLFDKTAANIQEVVARGGKVVLLSDKAGIDKLKDHVWETIELPEASPFAAPILYAIPVQLLAYHVAVKRGTDVDQPRNLAKSVTVE